MTLHEAMEEVLISNNRMPMAAKDIARIINERKLYDRGDGKPVPSSQISARANQYPNIFVKRNRLIELAQ
ncbi:MAG: hypothetical protein IKH58_05310 [Bacteroidales bacterium]|jgi:hypothetical protein|nr:hypothetical protein [Bacteroidales bacterium]